MLMFHVEMIVICYLAVFVDCDVVFAFYLCIISGTLSGTTSGTGTSRGSLSMWETLTVTVVISHVDFRYHERGS